MIMEMKRIVAPDMRTALRLVREQLGPDAIILSNRRVEQGVEVVSALEIPQGFGEDPKVDHREDTKSEAVEKPAQPEEEIPVISELAASPSSEQTKERDSANDIPTLDTPINRDEFDQFQAMQAELRGMRDVLEQQLGSMNWNNFSSSSPVQASLWRRLHNMGLPASVVKSCLADAEPAQPMETVWRHTLANLVNHTPTMGDITSKGGVFAFVGPTGVGKTTTIGKLAARHVLENGPDSVALLTLDTYRIGAYEQLRIIGRILRVPVKVIDDPGKLANELRKLSSKSLVLIDTAGLNHQDQRLAVQLQSLSEIQQIQNLLVVAANSQLETIKAAYHTYKRARLIGAILTKLDETCSLGESLGVLIEQRLRKRKQQKDDNEPGQELAFWTSISARQDSARAV
jgi:flagellar biosynthesis protein FlhF